MAKSIVVIPARYQSSRFPGKPLCMIDGVPMIQRVYEASVQSQLAQDVIVATDDKRISDVVKGFNGNVIMTSASHQTGTERVAEVAEKIKADYYINVQGDEPFLKPNNIDLVINDLEKNDSDISTLYYLAGFAEGKNKSRVKVVTNHKDEALYFSRSLIPYSQQPEDCTYRIHIGIYGYDRRFLTQLKSISGSELENQERLEQLRFLEAGYKIRALPTEKTGLSIDTPEDLAKAIRYLKTGEITAVSEFRNIKMIISDADGVLSPAQMLYGKYGEDQKVFNVRDGLGIKRLLQRGVKFCIVSGRGSNPLKYRLEELGISEYHFNVSDKAEICEQIMQKFGLDAADVIYIGDDLNDIPAFNVCGIRFTVADAPDEVRNAADYVLSSRGGEGAIRELIDRVLKNC